MHRIIAISTANAYWRGIEGAGIERGKAELLAVTGAAPHLGGSRTTPAAVSGRTFDAGQDGKEPRTTDGHHTPAHCLCSVSRPPRSADTECGSTGNAVGMR